MNVSRPLRSLVLALVTALSLATCASAASIRSAGAVANFPDIDGAKLAAAVTQSLGQKPDAWVLFAYDRPDNKENPTPQIFLQQLLTSIRAADPNIPLIGGWTFSGMFAIDKNQSVMGDCLLVGLTGEGVQFKAAISEFSSPAQLVPAAKQLCQELKPASGKGLMIFITDARPAHANYPVHAMFTAMAEALGPQVGIVGGNAAFIDKPVYFSDQVKTGAMVGLMLSGDIEFKIIVEPGKEPIAGPFTITKLAQPYEIVELDNRPWMDVYKEALTGYYDPNKFDETIAQGEGAFGGICSRFPYALVKEHDQLYVRFAHGLSPWGKGKNLPSEGYNPQIGDKLVITKNSPDQLGCVSAGMKRLNSDMPTGQQLFLLFPCESHANLIRRQSRAQFFETIKAQMPENATAFGFFPCGEHASWYEPHRDKQVIEGRYHQLSYPMAVVVAKP